MLRLVGCVVVLVGCVVVLAAAFAVLAGQMTDAGSLSLRDRLVSQAVLGGVLLLFPVLMLTAVAAVTRRWEYRR
ncbi:hypothetical protein CC117_25705 [Parafrankia colletiae]|uniref:Uncharacterized protein n=1 Tax=Parafrankia colletiae TaxID=573497 RepID=A0A1S1Q9T7_9ACTN|nr:hypothetical protein [Parafrankia colletiae]MCK9903586.1 hypothetical protein [Frankia sp. Cpl3]OHV31613.1 hypothetical protein CC117_25705 [Parafrankia colletiae]